MALIPLTNKITLDNVNRVLYSSQEPEFKKNIGLAAVYCLECLIAANGEPVSQEKLIFEGWRQHGIEVSSDSVRQVISQIRKALKSLGESPDILITLPKIGYRLNVNEFIQDEYIHYNLTPIKKDLEKASPYPLVSKYNKCITTVNKRWKMISLFTIAFFINIVIMIVVLFQNYLVSPETIHYTKVSNKDYIKKNIMIEASSAHTEISITKELDLLKQSPFWSQDNDKYQWIYINKTYNPRVHNFFLCDKSLVDPDVKCVTRMFWEE
ncbi:winged helix-turn-helix domain-containing protein [Enterobacter mori]|uniref:winged helix-turn-helix domain-containing protein n=1 Tax=Enterobacter mori TaxID=539813 RepID=UPI001BDF7D57|nr:winged helix-turn-helix domain-containing protein [Enterobacter mori]MBT1872779.1 winged helix-turn-helix domain-containing protein [Enterobacter mori]HBM8320061.1 winged helix-turn-helix domain-containing protein [Enterobacter cloacae]HCM9655476.1 winged helix-turn-helix domain-containing protein [Enterobacter kobei]